MDKGEQHQIGLKIEFTDEGPENWDAPKFALTQKRTGFVPTNLLLKLRGQNNENRDWRIRNGQKYFGNYPENEWYSFCEDIKTNGINEPIYIFVEKNGDIVVSEGNHRIQAAKQIGIGTIPAEIRYFGNSQKYVNLFDDITLK